MSMLMDYCNQTAVLKACAYDDNNQPMYDGYGQPIYSDEVSIKCRLEYGNKLTRDRQGQQVVSTAKVFTPTEIKIDDVINQRNVISSKPMISLDGDIEGYEVYLV